VQLLKLHGAGTTGLIATKKLALHSIMTNVYDIRVHQK